MIRTAALITAFLFFTAQGARAGDVTLAANAVLNNFLLISAFFLDGLANAAEQLCGRAYGARDRSALLQRDAAGRDPGALALRSAVAAVVCAVRPVPDRHHDRERGRAARARATICGSWCSRRCSACSPSPMTGSIIGATWARDMRNLMVAVTARSSSPPGLRCAPFGNAGLWGALLVHYAARGGLEALRYPRLFRASFCGAETPSTSPASPRP